MSKKKPNSAPSSSHCLTPSKYLSTGCLLVPRGARHVDGLRRQIDHTTDSISEQPCTLNLWHHVSDDECDDIPDHEHNHSRKQKPPLQAATQCSPSGTSFPVFRYQLAHESDHAQQEDNPIKQQEEARRIHDSQGMMPNPSTGQTARQQISLVMRLCAADADSRRFGLIKSYIYS